jgi:hypothetical protein
LLALALAGALAYWRYAATYAPLRLASFFAPYGSNASHYGNVYTDLGYEVYVKGPSGTKVQVITLLINDGSHDVTITGSSQNPLIPTVQLSHYVTEPGGLITGKALPLRSLPARIPAHHTARLVLTLVKPRCQPGIGISTDGTTLHWHALGVDHDLDVPVGLDTTFVGCPQHLH